MLWILFGSRYFFGFAWYFRAFWVVICVFLRYFCFVLFSVLCGDQPGLPAFVYRSFVLVFSSGLLFWFALICSGVWLWLVKVFCSGGFILFFCPCCVNCSAAIFFFFVRMSVLLRGNTPQGDCRRAAWLVKCDALAMIVVEVLGVALGWSVLGREEAMGVKWEIESQVNSQYRSLLLVWPINSQ